MTRFLLTLLALLTGLVATGGVAEARIGGAAGTEIGAVEGERPGARSQAGQPCVTETPTTQRDPRERDGGKAQPSRPKVYIPTVQFQIDRAFE